MITLTKVEVSRVLTGRQTMAVFPGRCRWRLGGKPHPLQRGAWGPIVGHVRLVAVARVRLSSLTDDDARRCGYGSLNSYKTAWRRQRGKWEGALEVTVLRFVLFDRPDEMVQASLLDQL